MTRHDRTIAAALVQESEPFLHLGREGLPRLYEMADVGPRLAGFHVAGDHVGGARLQLRFARPGNRVDEALLQDQLHLFRCLQQSLDSHFICRETV